MRPTAGCRRLPRGLAGHTAHPGIAAQGAVVAVGVERAGRDVARVVPERSVEPVVTPARACCRTSAPSRAQRPQPCSAARCTQGSGEPSETSPVPAWTGPSTGTARPTTCWMCGDQHGRTGADSESGPHGPWSWVRRGRRDALDQAGGRPFLTGRMTGQESEIRSPRPPSRRRHVPDCRTRRRGDSARVLGPANGDKVLLRDEEKGVASLVEMTRAISSPRLTTAETSAGTLAPLLTDLLPEEWEHSRQEPANQPELEELAAARLRAAFRADRVRAGSGSARGRGTADRSRGAPQRRRACRGSEAPCRAPAEPRAPGRGRPGGPQAAGLRPPPAQRRGGSPQLPLPGSRPRPSQRRVPTEPSADGGIRGGSRAGARGCDVRAGRRWLLRHAALRFVGASLRDSRRTARMAAGVIEPTHHSGPVRRPVAAFRKPSTVP